MFGDVGNNFGSYSSGERNGRIEVKGKVFGNVGENMHSGYLQSFNEGIHSCPQIYIGKDVSFRVGHNMLLGEIHINGHIGQIGESAGGKVYLRGRDVTCIPLKTRLVHALLNKLGC